MANTTITEAPLSMFAGGDVDDAPPAPSPIDRGDVFGEHTPPSDDIPPVPVPAPAPEPEPTPAPAPEPALAPTPEPEPAPAPEPAPSPAEPPKQIMLPKERYDRQKARADRLEAQLNQIMAAQQQQQQPGAQPQPAAMQSTMPDFMKSELMTDLVKRHQEAILDGNLDKAVELQTEMNQRIFDYSSRVASIDAQTAAKNERVRVEMDLAADEIASRFPELDDFNESVFNRDLAIEVRAITDSYVRNQMYSPAEALRVAAEMVMRRERPDYFGAPAPAAATPAPTPTPSRDVSPATAAATAVRVAGAQPPAPMAAAPNRPSLDISRMSDAEFNNLSEAELSRLRGDNI